MAVELTVMNGSDELLTHKEGIKVKREAGLNVTKCPMHP